MKKLWPIIWIILVLLLSLWGVSKVSDFMERRRVSQEGHDPGSDARVILVTYADESLPSGTETGSLVTSSCGDYMVPSIIRASSPRLESALGALTHYIPEDGLHNPLQEKGIRLEGTREGKDGVLEILLAGEPAFGGLCDTPRLKMQLEETIALYIRKSPRILLNGSEATYACMGQDEACILKKQRETLRR